MIDDLSPYLQDFGVLSTLNGTPLLGIFDNEAGNVLNMLGGQTPIFHCAAADLTSDPRGKTLIINSISYTVRDNKPDGTGLNILELEQQ